MGSDPQHGSVVRCAWIGCPVSSRKKAGPGGPADAKKASADDPLVARAIELAEQRLKNRPDELKDFGLWVRTAEGLMAAQQAASGPRNPNVFFDAVERAVDPRRWRADRDDRLLTFIDNWSEERQPAGLIAPLLPSKSKRVVEQKMGGAGVAAGTASEDARRVEMQRLRAKGVKDTAIARQFGITRQRVAQLIGSKTAERIAKAAEKSKG